MFKILKNNFSRVILLLVCVLFANSSFSQDFKITPTSRMLLDAASYSEKNLDLVDGVAVRDFRIGLKAYYEQFYLKADVSLAGNKVNMKDVYIQYNESENMLIRGGHFSMPFGLQSAYGTAHKQFMAEPSSNVFQVGRRIGIMHSLWNDKFWLSYGAFADNKALTESTDKSGKQGYTLSERFVYKPFYDEDQYLVQVGLSLAHTKAEAAGKGNPKSFNYKTTYLTSVDKTNAINALVDNARYENKGTVELAAIYKNFVLESQYYYSNIQRKDNRSFSSDGFYAIARGIIFNKADYKYSKSTAGINNPNNKALELALGYSMVDMNSSKAGIYGGKMSDVSLGLAFYWNKYVTLRTNYSYIEVKTTGAEPTKKVNAVQCRVQYYF